MKENLIDTCGANENNPLAGGDSRAFDISPVDLTKIVDKYKERGENYADIEYFRDQGGIDKLLNILQTDKQRGIASVSEREKHFGTNKIFKKPPPTLLDFIKEALSDAMIIILIFCSFFEIGISIYDNVKGKKNTEYIDGISIIFAVFVVVAVGSFTNYKKELKFQELNDTQNSQTKYNIIRNGAPLSIVADNLLVGDLIKINYGEILPADILMVEGNGIKIDESSLTGESDAMNKKPFEKCLEELEQGNSKPSSNILLSGTNVIEGAGAGIVIAVGEHSQKGIIRGTIDNAQENNKTPLEQKLDSIAKLIGFFGLGSAVVTLIALVIQMVVRFIQNDDFSFASMIEQLLEIVILCVSIIVVAIPEGLPLAVTLSLAFSIKRLMDNKNLVRKMHACETMGGANYICTDKTGTLTQNLMFVVRLVTHSESIEIKQNVKVDDVNLKSKSSKKLRQNRTEIIENNNYWEVLRTTVSLNVDATIQKLNTPNSDGDTEICESKNKTDKGFIEFLYQFQSPISEEKERYMSSPDNYKIFPFDSKKKRMSTFVKNENFPTGYRLFTKGGSENAMAYSNRYIDKSTGAVKELTEDIIAFVNNEINEMNKKMMRTLYICYRDITEEEYERCNEPDERGLLIDQKDLIFIGIFGLRDSLRPGVDAAVKKCHNAGVSVIMVTGDNLVTATAIAKECNIFPEKIDLDKPRLKDIERNPNDINDPNKRLEHIQELLNVKPYAMTGNSFYSVIGGIICQVCGKDTIACRCPKSEAEAEELAKQNNGVKKPVKIDVVQNMDNFRKISTNMLVMARSQPIHKYALVLGLKAMGHVVAVTGDGTNDAPALSKSDVGFSMADGTDIAKEASDIIIMDNNFTSIVVAMIYGRSIYENIRKFLQFQLTVNFCACILVFICSCVGNDTPLSSVQMLWVNLIMDSLGSLALATEPPYDELLNRKPTNRKESIINGRMWKHIILQSVFEITILVVLYLAAPKFVPEDKDVMREAIDLLKKCYDELPGKQKQEGDTYYILYGVKDEWSKSVNLTSNSSDCDNVKDRATLADAYDYIIMEYGGTTHMTLIFDTFVIYTLFNQINCRIIDDSLNTFKRITKGLMFLLVTGFELLIQIVISQFGYKIFKCVKWGLSFKQWLICLGLSITTMLVNLIIKFIPLEKVIDPCTKPKKEVYSDDTKASTTIKEMVNQLLPEA